MEDLPAEMLEELFDRVLDPNDWLAVTNSSQEWSDLMHYKKTNRLFGLILPILLASKDILLKEMLILRRVNREWKRAVDQALSDDPERHVLRFYNLHSDQWPPRVKEGRTYEQFLTHTQTLPQGSNPFLGHFAKMCHFLDNRVFQVLEAHGRHLKYVEIPCVNFDRQTNRENFGRALQLLPALETLEVTISGRQTDGLPDFTYLLPPLHNIRKLNFAHAAEQVVEQFITVYGPSLTSLSCAHRFLRNGDVRLLPKLKHWTIKGQVSAEELGALTQFRSPLEELSMNHYSVLLNNTLVSILNNFTTTLKSLHLGIQLGPNMELSSLQLQLFPNLEELRVHVYPASCREPDLPPLSVAAKAHLLGRAPNLKILEVTICNNAFPLVNLDNLDTSQFHNMFRKLRSLNIKRQSE